MEHVAATDGTLSRLGGWEWVGLIVVVWTLTHCSTLFLLLAITALGQHRAIVNSIWKYRVLLDVCVTAGALGWMRLSAGSFAGWR